MSEPLDELVERFRRAGCPNPLPWAKSEAEEDLPQFARFVFLRELWKCVEKPGSRTWLRTLDLPNDDGVGGVKRRLVDSTAEVADLTELVRAAQIDMLRKVVDLIDGYAPEGGMVEESAWGLFEVDDDGKPTRCMDGLHESVGDPDVGGQERT